MNIYENDALVADLTRGLVRRGYKVFHIFKTGDDHCHVGNLLRVFDLPKGARVLDAGCGVGEVSRLMKKQRPDLEFVLQNVSVAQLKMCPWGYLKVLGSFEDIPMPDGSFDGVMFNYSLGHGDIEKAFSEAARLLKSSGVLLVYDMDGDREVLGYQVRPSVAVISAAASLGLIATPVEAIEADTDDFRAAMTGENLEDVLTDVGPALYRFVKC